MEYTRISQKIIRFFIIDIDNCVRKELKRIENILIKLYCKLALKYYIARFF